MNKPYREIIPGFPFHGEKQGADDIYIITEEGELSYSEFHSRAERTAVWLASMGVKKRDRCAIISGNSDEFMILVFAVWTIGAIPVPLNIRLLDSEIEQQAEKCRCSHIFTSRDLPSRNITNAIVFPPEVLPDGEAEWSRKEEDDTALILFTSGSTGISKGVMLTFRNLAASNKGTAGLTGNKINDRWLASLPFYHIGGFSIPIRAYMNGIQTVIPKSIKAENLLTVTDTFRPSLLSLVSTSFRQMLEAGAKPWPELRYIFLGGGPVEEKLAKEAIEKKWPVIKVYGSTETSSMVTALKINDHTDKLASAGRAISGNAIYIRDDNGNTLPAGEMGEVVIAGESLMSGYFEEDNLTKEKLRDNEYYSGDLGYLDEEGFLFIEMRRTDLIVSGGENINPLEVERAISEYPGVKEVCVFPVTDEQWGQAAAAAIAADNEEIFDQEDLRLFIRSRLAHYKVPKKIFFVPELPKTPLGKIKRELIADIYREP
ncbi:MAG: o-succinylbenzoate--CoA ligase [Syntrophothermus sp.]